MKSLGLSLVGLLACGSVSSAAITVQVSPGVDLGNDLVRYDVRLVADLSADKATAWQGEISGPFNNILAGGFLSIPTLDNSAFLGADVGKDTHFMFLNADTLPSEPPLEENLGGGNWRLSAAIGFKPSIQSQDFLLAQVILPEGQTATMTSMTGRANGDLFTTNATIGEVPEPATIGLLGIAGIAILRRKRA